MPLARGSSGGGRRFAAEGEEHRRFLRAGLARERAGIMGGVGAWWTACRDQDRRKALQLKPGLMRANAVLSGMLTIVMAWQAVNPKSLPRPLYVLGAVIAALSAWIWCLLLRWRRQFNPEG